MPGVFSGASSSAGGKILEVPIPIVTTSGKKLALATIAGGRSSV